MTERLPSNCCFTDWSIRAASPMLDPKSRLALYKMGSLPGYC